MGAISPVVPLTKEIGGLAPIGFWRPSEQARDKAYLSWGGPPRTDETPPPPPPPQTGGGVSAPVPPAPGPRVLSMTPILTFFFPESEYPILSSPLLGLRVPEATITPPEDTSNRRTKPDRGTVRDVLDRPAELKAWRGS